MCQGEKKQNAEKPKSCGITAEWFHLFISYYLEPRRAAAGRVCAGGGREPQHRRAAIAPMRGWPHGPFPPLSSCVQGCDPRPWVGGLGGAGAGQPWGGTNGL